MNRSALTLDVKVKFVAYFSRIFGEKELKIEQDSPTVEKVIEYLKSMNEEFTNVFTESSPEVSIIVDGKTIQYPADKNMQVNNELVISPIIAGG